MPDPKRDGGYLLLLGILSFVLLGVAFERFSSLAMLDFKAPYYAARCLLEHQDPYIPTNLGRIYRVEGGTHFGDSAGVTTIVTRYNYFPSAFTFTLPLAELNFGVAQSIWMLATIASLTLACYLIWQSAAQIAPVFSGALIAFLLANNFGIVVGGNAAGIVIGLCVIASWCFLNNRLIALGVVCLAISLALKPHDSGLVWLYFFLAGGSHRKRVLATLAVLVVLSAPSLFLLTKIAPNWLSELRGNLAANSARGDLSDPGPASAGVRASMINLQTVISEFRDDPSVYNPVVYCMVGIPLLIWAITTVRSGAAGQSAWYGLAAVTALSMLPVYHRNDDAFLLILTVPACARLWAKGGLAGQLVFVLTAAGFFFVGDVLWPVLFYLVSRSHLMGGASLQRFLAAAQVYPSPCLLLLIGVFYLWVYVKSAPLKPDRAMQSTVG